MSQDRAQQLKAQNEALLAYYTRIAVANSQPPVPNTPHGNVNQMLFFVPQQMHYIQYAPGQPGPISASGVCAHPQPIPAGQNEGMFFQPSVRMAVCYAPAEGLIPLVPYIAVGNAAADFSRGSSSTANYTAAGDGMSGQQSTDEGIFRQGGHRGLNATEQISEHHLALVQPGAPGNGFQEPFEQQPVVNGKKSVGNAQEPARTSEKPAGDTHVTREIADFPDRFCANCNTVQKAIEFGPISRFHSVCRTCRSRHGVVGDSRVYCSMCKKFRDAEEFTTVKDNKYARSCDRCRNRDAEAKRKQRAEIRRSGGAGTA
ncbi:hypothetical protein RUND412_008473 [Rhizina undulata]